MGVERPPQSGEAAIRLTRARGEALVRLGMVVEDHAPDELDALDAICSQLKRAAT